MNRLMFYGLGAFVVILGIVGLYLILQPDPEPTEVYKMPSEEVSDKIRNIETIANVPPRPARAGHKWEWHDDQWHEKLLVAQAQPVVKPVQPKQQAKPTYTGQLTYHAELLKTNPVKALRLQQEERGHWSAEWIPPFPPDDSEAQEYARVNYLRKYYMLNFGKLLETPEYEKENKEISKAQAISRQMRRTIMSYPYGARSCDLMKLTWVSLDSPPSYPGLDPSEYFGNPEVRELLKRAGAWKY